MKYLRAKIITTTKTTTTTATITIIIITIIIIKIKIRLAVEKPPSFFNVFQFVSSDTTWLL